MKRQHLAVPAMVGLSLIGCIGQASAVQFGNMKADRILFFGNSITISPGAVPGTNWTGGWGMAASAPEKDYVHLVTSSIAQAAGATPQILATYNRSWEQNFATYDMNTPEMQDQLAFQPDIVVVAVGENVPSLNTSQLQTQFAASFGELLNTFKRHGDPAIFVRSCFWPDAAKDKIMKQTTEAAGCVFVDQSRLASPDNSSLWAVNEEGNPYRGVGAGVDAHPGDKGMKAIADSLYGAMAAHAVPEPGTLGLLGFAVPLIALLSARRRRLLRIEKPVA